MLGRLRGTPRLWVFLILCALLAAVAGLQLTGLRTELKGGEIGFSVQRRPGIPLVGSVDSRWAQLRNGDQVLAFNGQPVTLDEFFAVRTALPIGPLSVSLLRDGASLELHGEVTPLRPLTALSIALRWLTGVALFVLAAGVFLLRPGATLSWLFFLFLSAIGCLVMVMQGFPASLSTVWTGLHLMFVMAPLLGFHFFALFPSQWSAHRLAKWLYPTGFAVWAMMVFVSESGYFELDTEVHIGLAVRAFSLLGGLGVLAAVIHQYRFARRQNDPRLISVTRTLTFATIGGLFTPLLANTVVRLTGTEGGIAHQISAISVLIFGVVTAMVLVRHNPLEIDRYAASVVGYVVTLGALGGVFVLALFTLPLVAQRLGFANSSEALVGLTAVIFASVGPVYRRLRKSVDRWFSGEQADALQTAEAVRHIADSVQSDPRDLSLQKIVDAALIIGPEQVALWQIDSTGRSMQRVYARQGEKMVETIDRSGPIQRLLDRAGGVEGLAPGLLPEATQQALWSMGLAMSAPVRAHGVPVGFLAVGRRLSGFAYREEDLSFLGTLASQAGLALERGELVTQIGRYRIERRLAQGGMAEVFVAWQLGPGGFERKVALKRLLPELAEDPRSAAGLLDEARITSRLQHPNIAQVFEAGLEAGQHFIAMEFIDGPPLRTLIANQRRTNRPTPLPVALNIARGLLAGLTHAHQLHDEHGQHQRVVHRDVTPANVLVSSRGETKLVDFGLVMASTRLFKTQTGVARGTLPYMSPEQAVHDDALDHRSDVYSAAATLFELLTAERAFPDGPKGARALPIAISNRLLPEGLSTVFAKAFETEMEARYVSANAFWEAIREETLGVAIASNAEVASWMTRHRMAPEAPSPDTEITASASLAHPAEPPGG